MRNRSALIAGVGVVAAMVAGEREARACGGCIPPPSEIETVITDEKMMYAISKDQTTLYDEITYSGSPSSFSWVLPIKGTVTVGLSADILFQTIDALTATVVNAPTPPVCPSSGYTTYGGGGEGGAGGGDGGGGVTVLTQGTVGPYETVQLKSTDGSALTNWLKSHGYVLPAKDAPVIAAYVAQGFDFLAMKLVPGAGIQAMQPVRITSKGASISLPLHMVAVGTGATTGITIWVVADGRWEPKNFPIFTITDSELVWDWTTSSSNYETLRLSKEASFGGRGWQLESSIELSQQTIRDTLFSNIQYGVDGGIYEAGPYSDAGDATVSATDGGGSADAAAYDDTVATADLAVLFAGIAGSNARITRMRSDVAHSALSVDMYLQASADQTELTNQHYPTKTTGDYCGPGYDGGPGDSSGPGASNGPGCSTTGPQDGPATTLAILLGVVGIGAAGIRRRRRAP